MTQTRHTTHVCAAMRRAAIPTASAASAEHHSPPPAARYPLLLGSIDRRLDADADIAAHDTQRAPTVFHHSPTSAVVAASMTIIITVRRVIVTVGLRLCARRCGWWVTDTQPRAQPMQCATTRWCEQQRTRGVIGEECECVVQSRPVHP